MKKCRICQLEKTLDCFASNVSRKDKLQTYCRDCHSKYTKDHYENNKSYYKTKARKRTNLLRKQYNEYKESLPCFDCKKNYPYYVMDFDHRDKELKSTEVAKLVDRSAQKLLEEIEKCDLVCSNCHRERTHNRIYEAIAQLDRACGYEPQG